MKIELWINGFLHDEIEAKESQERLTKRMKDKWWFLLSRSNWRIYVVRKSKANPAAVSEPGTAIQHIESIVPVKIKAA